MAIQQNMVSDIEELRFRETEKFNQNLKPLTRIKVKLVTVVKSDPKAPFSVATTLRCRRGRYSFPLIALLYP